MDEDGCDGCLALKVHAEQLLNELHCMCIIVWLIYCDCCAPGEYSGGGGGELSFGERSGRTKVFRNLELIYLWTSVF